ncbi:MAG: polysulfide reductase NrfD [Deltaproteobacteria bacterium]|nr:polysulfide reductase NrfD [Deltaproteobacteria bacterium]
MNVAANPFSDSLVMEPKPQTIWGVPHATWFFAMGIGGALFINRALFGMDLGRVFGLIVADVLSMILISIAGLVLISDLGKPLRVLRALMNPRTSWISIGAICDFVFLILDGLWLIADLEIGGQRPFSDLLWAGNSPLGIIFQCVAGAAAFVVIIYPGLVLASSPAIPFWNTTLIPLQFLIFAFANGVGLALISALWVEVPQSLLTVWGTAEVLLFASALILFFAHLLNGVYSQTAAQISVSRLLNGDLRPFFVWGTLVLGLLLPLCLGLYGTLWANPGPGVVLLALSALISLPGNWFSKYAVIKAGTYAPLI